MEVVNYIGVEKREKNHQELVQGTKQTILVKLPKIW